MSVTKRCQRGEPAAERATETGLRRASRLGPVQALRRGEGEGPPSGATRRVRSFPLGHG